MKALIAMSGGVDSSVAAFLMQEAGFSCSGAIMLLCTPQLPGCQATATEDAQDVAARLGMPFYTFDCSEAFRRKVVDHFVATYEKGGTPNPCIECNRHLKFGAFLELALGMGFDRIATGHYARIHQDPQTGRYLLSQPADLAKDQTYFLYSLTQHQLAHTCFPLGELTKDAVRQIAERKSLRNAKKRDSQDICFIPSGDYMDFIRSYTGKDYPCGSFLDKGGNVVGSHTGAVSYTIGQRKGLGLAMGAPVYVCSKDMAANTVTVGGHEDLMRTTLRAQNWNWIALDELRAPIRIHAKVRYRHTAQPATVYPESDGTARVVFDEPQRAITAGQAVVLYDGAYVVGGGTITEVL